MEQNQDGGVLPTGGRGSDSLQQLPQAARERIRLLSTFSRALILNVVQSRGFRQED